jgi:flagellar biogenesis protein FliO
MVVSAKKNAILSSSMVFLIGLIFGLMYAIVRVFQYDIERYEHDATPDSVRNYIRQTAGCEDFKQTTLR